jgi:outer membrane immunogenic protein
MRAAQTLRAALILALFFTATGANAQKSNMTIGPRIGLTITSYSGEDANGTDHTSDNGMGLAIGGELNYWISPDLAFMPQLLYVQKVAKDEASSGSLKLKVTSSLSYIEIPLLMKYKVGSGQTAPYFFAGPSLGFFAGGSVTADLNGKEESHDADNAAGTEFALIIGAGLSHRLDPKTALVFDFLYQHGLTNRADDDDVAESFHRGFRIGAGVQFAM